MRFFFFFLLSKVGFLGIGAVHWASQESLGCYGNEKAQIVLGFLHHNSLLSFSPSVLIPCGETVTFSGLLAPGRPSFFLVFILFWLFLFLSFSFRDQKNTSL